MNKIVGNSTNYFQDRLPSISSEMEDIRAINGGIFPETDEDKCNISLKIAQSQTITDERKIILMQTLLSEVKEIKFNGLEDSNETEEMAFFQTVFMNLAGLSEHKEEWIKEEETTALAWINISKKLNMHVVSIASSPSKITLSFAASPETPASINIEKCTFEILNPCDSTSHQLFTTIYSLTQLTVLHLNQWSLRSQTKEESTLIKNLFNQISKVEKLIIEYSHVDSEVFMFLSTTIKQANNLKVLHINNNYTKNNDNENQYAALNELMPAVFNHPKLEIVRFKHEKLFDWMIMSDNRNPFFEKLKANLSLKELILTSGYASQKLQKIERNSLKNKAIIATGMANVLRYNKILTYFSIDNIRLPDNGARWLAANKEQTLQENGQYTPLAFLINLYASSPNTPTEVLNIIHQYIVWQGVDKDLVS